MKPLLTLALLSTATSLALAQAPARHDILAACPQLAEQLPEQLASVKNELGREGTVRVQLILDARGLQRIESISGPRSYLPRVRSALQGLDCKPAEAQRFVLNIRFGEEGLPSARQFAAATAP